MFKEDLFAGAHRARRKPWPRRVSKYVPRLPLMPFSCHVVSALFIFMQMSNYFVVYANEQRTHWDMPTMSSVGLNCIISQSQPEIVANGRSS